MFIYILFYLYIFIMCVCYHLTVNKAFQIVYHAVGYLLFQEENTIS